MSSGLDVLLPLFHAGCNSCSIIATRPFGSSPGVVLSRRYLYDLSSLPPFYRGLLSAWVVAEGSFSATRESLVVVSFSCESPIAVAEATT